MSLVADNTHQQHLGRFGLKAFRPGQLEVISAVLAGRDCLCIMPTGGGKSLCYQLPAIARDGLTVVVSPLIALMKDQVDALSRTGIPAACINSHQSLDEQHERLEGARAGRYRLLYVAPERLRNPRFVETLAATHVQLLAVDEAHCVSEWGHDFRPDYARIAGFRRRIGNPQTIALTATATAHVRADVAQLLDLREPAAFITGFARPNLHFEVVYAGGNRNKVLKLVELLNETEGSAIVYASTRKRCDEAAEALRQATRRKVGVYHAGMEGDDRRRAQDLFMAGKHDVIVATNAFGMGIDKPDLRLVVHYNMPGCIEAYYQEAGRAGRDGADSRCVLLYSPGDRNVQEFFIENSYPTSETIEKVYDFLRVQRADPIELTQEEIKEGARLSVGAEAVGASEQILARCGVLERLESRQNMASVKLASDLPSLVDLLPTGAKVQRKVMRALQEIVGERRHERVFFQPRSLAERTGLEPPALARALREIADLKTVDYVPPFRGRAVHMLEREKDFAELPLDLETLDRRRNAEYEKLNRMENYCRTRRCRQWEVLDYFGDPDGGACGVCDNCRQGGIAKPKTATRGAALIVEQEETIEVVARIEEVKAVAPVPPPHSTGRDPAARDARESGPRREGNTGFDWRADLQSKGTSTREDSSHLEVDRREQRSAAKSPAGREPRQAQEPRGQHEAAEEMPKRSAPTNLDPLTEAVLIALSGVARTNARFGKQMIAQMLAGSKSAKMQKLRLDRLSTFGRLAHLKQDEIAGLLDDLLAARLLEQQEKERFRPILQLTPTGQQVLRSELSLASQGDLEERVAYRLARIHGRPASRPSKEAGGGESARRDDAQQIGADGKPNFFWTWRVFHAGFTLAECQQIRGLAEEAILDHLAAAGAAGLPLSLDWFLPEADLRALADAPSSLSALSPSHRRLVELYRSRNPDA